MVTQFDPQQAILELARRTLRSLSNASTCSLLSVYSVSSLTSLSPSGDDCAEDIAQEEILEDPKETPPQIERSGQEASSSSGKRKRKKNPDKEAERQAKRRKKNSRKRAIPWKDGLRNGKLRMGMKRAVQTGVGYEMLSLSTKKVPGHSRRWKTLEDVKRSGMMVLEWDGV